MLSRLSVNVCWRLLLKEPPYMTKKKQNKTKKRKEKKKEKGENKRTWIEKRYCLFLACNHVTRRLGWWCVGGQYNRIVSRRSYLKIGSGSQKREMLLFLTLTHHHHGCRDVMCKPAGNWRNIARRGSEEGTGSRYEPEGDQINYY